MKKYNHDQSFDDVKDIDEFFSSPPQTPMYKYNRFNNYKDDQDDDDLLNYGHPSMSFKSPYKPSLSHSHNNHFSSSYNRLHKDDQQQQSQQHQFNNSTHNNRLFSDGYNSSTMIPSTPVHGKQAVPSTPMNHYYTAYPSSAIKDDTESKYSKFSNNNSVNNNNNYNNRMPTTPSRFKTPVKQPYHLQNKPLSVKPMLTPQRLPPITPKRLPVTPKRNITVTPKRAPLTINPHHQSQPISQIFSSSATKKYPPRPANDSLLTSSLNIMKDIDTISNSTKKNYSNKENHYKNISNNNNNTIRGRYRYIDDDDLDEDIDKMYFSPPKTPFMPSAKKKQMFSQSSQQQPLPPTPLFLSDLDNARTPSPFKFQFLDLYHNKK
ncbi:hypothetical protein CYY_008118 [Polysphondylium violaceum]|uniref:Uncharacterized protein n=1 Tax=Polysphondylium violaceum TaxID=133409 RepID=A0A8J4PVZ9_9MYCE|nr:hypothetical protein CYY_008118 [Polysphondylium violaceum]